MTRTRLLPLAALGVLLLVPAAGPAGEPQSPVHDTKSPQPKAGSKKEKAESQRKLIASLPPAYQEWLREVAPIISKEEIAGFLELEKDYQRDAFIERFWKVRDPYPDTARNEARDAWESRLAQAKTEFASLDGDRAKVFLLNGPPQIRNAGHCVGLWPIEVWAYAQSTRLPDGMVLIFYQRLGQGTYTMWQPLEGLGALFQFPPVQSNPSQLFQQIVDSCRQTDQIAAAISAVSRKGAMSYSLEMLRALKPIEAPSREWVDTFNSYSTDLPADAKPLPATLRLGFPGRVQSRTVVQGTLAVPVDKATTASFEGRKSYDFLLNGEVLFGDKLFDSFRYKFDMPAKSVDTPEIPLVFERLLRPGTYTLIVKLEDLDGGAYYRHQQTLEVPDIRQAPQRTVDDETAKILAEANAALSTLDDTIKIIQPQGEFQSGLVRFDTVSTGPDIHEVEFLLDGRQILRKNRPPFSVELDLGEVPRTRTLRAEALDGKGDEVASDEILLNASPHRFSIRLTEPQRGRHYNRSLRAEAQVEVPEDASLQRVEFYLNEDLVATLYQPPWTAPIRLPSDLGLAYVRAVAYEADGNSTEDIVFVNAPQGLSEELEIQYVELYAAVLDRDKHPVTTLQQSDFTVAEDGVPQTIARFEKVQNLPIHVAVLLDTSASMAPRLDAARQAALKFFEDTITPKDRAALIPFNDHPLLAVKMTNRTEDLAAGLAGLKAERGTSLYDSVVFSLFYFNGIKGQRAMLLLSDGKDENSRFTFDQTLDFARRAGVSIYTIGLDIGRTELETRRVLRSLAAETGGRSFFVKSPSELAAIYGTIQQELRSRYLIAYQSTNTNRNLKFRIVQVKVDRPGLKVVTVHGYYP